jgi:dihydrodipicolinate synthase/N-acetylneuraminate lyase
VHLTSTHNPANAWQVQPGSYALRLEGWCHRTLRVPLLPPTREQRQPDSDYRQDAFCLR